jgi:hypothetical protein
MKNQEEEKMEYEEDEGRKTAKGEKIDVEEREGRRDLKCIMENKTEEIKNDKE